MLLGMKFPEVVAAKSCKWQKKYILFAHSDFLLYLCNRNELYSEGTGRAPSTLNTQL